MGKNVLGLDHDRFDRCVVHYFNVISVALSKDALVKSVVVAKVCYGTCKILGDGATREWPDYTVTFALPTIWHNRVKRIVIACISGYGSALSHGDYPFPGVLNNVQQVSVEQIDAKNGLEDARSDTCLSKSISPVTIDDSKPVCDFGDSLERLPRVRGKTKNPVPCTLGSLYSSMTHQAV
jgi:hypothetical protein